MSKKCGHCQAYYVPEQRATYGGGVVEIGSQLIHACSHDCAQQIIGPLMGAGTKRPSDEPEPAKAERSPPPAETYESIRNSLATYGNGVTLQTSNIPGAGLGLFATRRFEAGEPITEYTGQIIDDKKARSLSASERSHVRTKFPMRLHIDGKNMPDGTPITDPETQMSGRGIAAFANDARDDPRYSNNAVFDFVDTPATDRMIAAGQLARLPREGERIVFLRALGPIEPGAEIMIRYGDDYWRALAGPARRSIFS